ncbi:unnamed protein product [Caenorhabditis bovis]|uniref:TAF6 C-terminal HEAT repeat domain-containing protein n=1 Tax=Caenorhabditis bovis TaxID=2654633 RepID=A0A8S1FBY0_9PELO|nr:unnamed protein product [Caenorhabditis bovis]
MSLIHDGSDTIGKYIIYDGRLIKAKSAKIVPSETKDDFFKSLMSLCAAQNAKHIRKYHEKEDRIVQTKNDISESKMKRVKNIEDIHVDTSSMPAALGEVLRNLSRDPMSSNLANCLTGKGAESVGNAVRQVLRNIVKEAKKLANHGNRKRLMTEDIDLAVTVLRLNPDLLFPVAKSSANTERTYWGRRIMRRPPHTISAQSAEIVSNEKFYDVPIIREHWLCIEGVQPSVPENAISSEVKKKIKDEMENMQRNYGYGALGVRKEKNLEKRLSKQQFSLEHQVLFNDIVNMIASGTPIERQKALQTVETDSGLQFLAGRFVILIAEGVRVNIGSRNVRGVSNLLKLTWSLMKNPRICLERYLHVLVPALLSCVVAKSIIPLVDVGRAGPSSSKSRTSVIGIGPTDIVISKEEELKLQQDLELEFRIRETSGRLLAQICEKYPTQHVNARLVQILRKVLTGCVDLASIYGALCTYFALGYLTIYSVLIPRLHEIFCAIHSFTVDDVQAVKTAPTKLKKIAVEFESKRLEWCKNRIVELVMKILYEFETSSVSERKVISEQSFVDSYAEFGTMFFRYLIETGKIDEIGRISANRESILKLPQRKSTYQTDARIPVPYKSSNYTEPQRKSQIDEDMLDDLLDDSNRPWVEVSKRVDLNNEEEKSECSSNFFGRARLVIVRKNAERKIAYFRPLEPISMPTAPTIRRGLGKIVENRAAPIPGNIAAAGVRTSRSAISVDDQALSLISKDPSELLRKYLNRNSDQAAAAVYGRKVDNSEIGQKTLDRLISEAAYKLNTVSLPNAVCGQTFPPSFKSEVNRGKFLTPTIQRTNQL